MSKNQGLYHLVAGDDNDGDVPTQQLTRSRGISKVLIVLAICCVIVLLVLIGVGLALYFTVFKKDSSSDDVSDCITPDVCNSRLLDYIDASIEPCEDFYQFSCGNWLASNPLGDRDTVGTFVSLSLDNYDHLMGYLSQPVRDSDPVAIKKTKYIYSACKDVDFIQANLVQHLQNFINDAGGWSDIGITPDDGWNIDEDLAGHHYLGSSAFFEIGILPDDLNSSKPVIKIAQGGLTLSSPQQYEDDDDFSSLVDEIVGVLDAVSSVEVDTMSLAEDIANYERSLAREWLTDTELRNLTAIYNPMTLQELSDLFNLDWVNYFDTFFSEGGFPNAQFTNDTVVVVLTPEYFRNINSLVFSSSVSNSRTINYARWQLLLSEVSNAAASLDNGWDIIHTRKIKFPSTRASEATQLACVQLVESAMPFAVARPFVEEFTPDEVISRVNDTANEILKTFSNRIMGMDWLDNVTQGRCIEKVEAITRQIAYPDFIKVDSELDKYYEQLTIRSTDNYFEMGSAVRQFMYHQQLSQYMKPIDKSEWSSAPTEVNAYYSPPSNQFVFLAGILRTPFFASNWPPFLLYGAFGVVVGHELTHGFDDQGQQYNLYGNRIPWWTDSSIAEFKQRTQCFVEQYDQYNLQGYQVDGLLTLGENIADNGGIHTAFQAYKRVMTRMMNQTGEEVITIRGYTHDQLFFVAFAQLWCSRFSDDYLESSTQTDPHSPGPIRVLGSLVNSEEFAAAFNCSRGSKMNPTTNKCQLW